MRLIGITGKSGAGKTTFSNYLAENSKEIEVIHIDDLLKEVKLKYFKLIMKKNKDGEKVKVDSRLKKMLYQNKYIFNLFIKFRAYLISPLLIRRIEEAKNKRIILVDDIFIRYHKIYNQFEEIYVLERNYIDRTQSLQERDGIAKEEVVAYDMAHHMKNYKEIKDDDRVLRVENNGDKEELKEIARNIYMQKMLSSKEKMINSYRCDGLKNIRISSKEKTSKIKKGEFSR